MYGIYDGWGVGNTMGWFGGGIMMIIFWAAFILFIVWIVGKVSGRNNSDKTRQGKSAFEILEERYAKGEIDKKKFEEKKRGLSS